MSNATKITAYLDGLTNCFVAGGAITSIYTNRPINDFDIYPKNDQALNDAIAWAHEQTGYWCVDHSSRAMTFAKGDKGENPQIQIMHFDVFETTEKIFDFFDFTMCMGAYDLDEGKFILHEMFLEHCSQRFLSFNRKTKFPYASARRVKKFEERGYTIGVIEYQKILLACASKPILTWDDLREQVGGIYGEAITIPDDEEFSEEGMWKALDTLAFKGPSGGFDTAEDAIASVSRIPVKCFKRDGELYSDLAQEGMFKKLSFRPKNICEISITEAYSNLTFFKSVVLKPDGRIMSPHQTNFEWKIGETIVSPRGPGIFIYATKQLAKNHYASAYGGDKIMILELKAEEESDITFESEFTLKKAKAVALHDKDGIKDIEYPDPF